MLQDLHNSLYIVSRFLQGLHSPLLHSKQLESKLRNITRDGFICHQVSPQGHLRPPPSLPMHQLWGHFPGQLWKVDFTHMPPHHKHKYLLTVTDTFSGWIEVFPVTTKQDSEVTRVLLQGIIPRLGLLTSLQSDNDPPFTSQSTQQISQALNISYKLHVARYPQSSGEVEKALCTLKQQLTKLSLELIKSG